MTRDLNQPIAQTIAQSRADALYPGFRMHRHVWISGVAACFGLIMLAALTWFSLRERWIVGDDLGMQLTVAAIMLVATSVTLMFGHRAAADALAVMRCRDGATVVQLRVVSRVERGGVDEFVLQSKTGDTLLWSRPVSGPLWADAAHIVALAPISGGAPVPLGTDGFPFALTPAGRSRVTSTAGAPVIDGTNTDAPHLPLTLLPTTIGTRIQRLRLAWFVMLGAASLAATQLPTEERVVPLVGFALFGVLSVMSVPQWLRLRAIVSALHVTDNGVTLSSPVGRRRIAWADIAEVVVDTFDPVAFSFGNGMADRLIRRVLAHTVKSDRLDDYPNDALSTQLRRAKISGEADIILRTADGRRLLRLQTSHGWDAAYVVGAAAATRGIGVVVVQRVG